jgi:oligosaccharide repeat unit polymerase
MINDDINFIFAILIFIISTLLLILIINKELKLKLVAYPSLALLGIGVIYLQFIVTGMLLWYFPSLGEGYRNRFGYGYEYYSISMFYGFIAMLFTYIGYISISKISKGNVNFIKQNLFIKKYIKTFTVLSLILVFISLLIIFYKQSIGLIHYGSVISVYGKQHDTFSKILTLLAHFTSIGYIFIVYTLVIFKNTIWKAIVFIIIGINLYFASLNGGALGLMGVMFPLFILYFYRCYIPYLKETRKIKISLFIIFFTLLIGILFIVKEFIRSLIRSGASIEIIDAISLIDLSGFGIALQFGLTHFIRELSAIDLMSLIAYKIDTGEQDYRYGYTYLLMFISFIPSLLWSSKPEISQTIWFADNYWRSYEDILKNGEGLQGNNFYLTGEAYMNFGFYAIPIEMFAYGLVIGIITKYTLIGNNLNFIQYIFITKIFYDIVHPATTMAALMSIILKQAIIIFIVLAILFFVVKILNYIRRNLF